MNKTLIKTKIVLEDNGSAIRVYTWKKTFWLFGHWCPNGGTNTIGKISNSKIDIINDKTVAQLFLDNFLRGFN